MTMPSRRVICGMIPLVVGAWAMSSRPARAADLKVVYYNAFPPLSFENDSHDIVGILPDMLTEILANRMKLSVTMQGMPWARAQASLQDASADAFCTLITPPRLEYAMFTRTALMTLKTNVFYAVDNPRRAEIEAIRTVDQLKGFHQGDYIGNGFAAATFKDQPIDYVPTLEAVFKKIEAGRTDVFVGTDLVGKGVVKELGLTDKIKSFPVNIGAPTPFNIGIRKTYPDVAALIAKADEASVAALKDGTLAKVIQKYTG